MTLWLPADSTVQPLLMIQDADAVWSGANLSSIINSGSEGGSWTVTGVPDQGTAINGVTPIRFNADTEAVTKTLDFPNTGKLSFFYYDRFISAGVGQNGVINRGWNNGAFNNKLVHTSNASGFSCNAALMANRNVSTDSAPSWEATSQFQTAGTINSVYGQGGIINDAWVDGVQKALTGTNINATFPLAGAAPDYASAPWEFGRGDGANPTQSAISEFLCIALFSDNLTTSERNRWEGYWHWRGGTQAQLPAAHPFRNAPPTNGKDIRTFGVQQSGAASFTRMIGY